MGEARPLGTLPPPEASPLDHLPAPAGVDRLLDIALEAALAATGAVAVHLRLGGEGEDQPATIERATAARGRRLARAVGERLEAGTSLPPLALFRFLDRARLADLLPPLGHDRVAAEDDASSPWQIAIVPIEGNDGRRCGLGVFARPRPATPDPVGWPLRGVGRQVGAAVEQLRLVRAERRRLQVELDRARAHIAAQTTQIQVIVAQAAEAIYVCDADGLLILANLPAARMFGLTTPEQMRRHVTDLATLVDISTPDGVRLGPRDLFLHRALTERRVIRGEYIIRNPRTGEESVRRVSAAPLVDAGGAPRGAVAVASDISALVELQRLAEIEVEAAKQQRQQLQAILDGLADPVCVFDAAWRVLLANQRLTQTLGLPPDIVGRHATELDDLVPGRFVQMEATERMTSLEERMRADAVDEVTVGDPPRIFRRAASGVYDAAGLPSAYIFLYHDITPLREVERLKDEFLATVSHDLRSPLHHIKGYASTLLRQDIEWEAATQRRFLRIIDRECDRMTRIVVNLLDLARLEDAAAAWLHRTRCELAGIVRVAVERSHPATETHPVQVDLAPDLPPILGDARWLEQVVANLLDNAAKYSPEGAPISVSLHPAEQGQLLTVADRGIGIAPEHLTAIFGRFYRAPAQRRVRGSGLGLAICHRIVTAHGGRIWAESEVELGSRFFVWLPTGGDS